MSDFYTADCWCKLCSNDQEAIELFVQLRLLLRSFVIISGTRVALFFGPRPVLEIAVFCQTAQYDSEELVDLW